MAKKIICGIQQMGIGVPNVEEVWKWYRKFFGIDIKVFEDAADAPLMIKYTGDKVQHRTATLALSMEGGGGMEIWQYKSRSTEKAAFDIQLGDYGIYICRIKSHNVADSYDYFVKNGAKVLGPLHAAPNGEKHFFVEDPNGNIFNVVHEDNRFSETKFDGKTGGVAGAMIGVSDMNAAMKFYGDILGYTLVEYDKTENFTDLHSLPGGDNEVRRVLLAHPEERKGPFAKMLGPSKIELIQNLQRPDCKAIFENRFWGDWGFIHLCFDVQGMNELKTECEEKGYPFTVDSGDTFDMGEAGGRFAYVEDPAGTLIEFVETHKVPIMKKMGWYINLKKRNPEQYLPNWMLKAMRFNRVK